MVALSQEEVGYLSIKQAAEALGVNPSALYQAIHAGRLHTYLVVGKRVLKRADVEAYHPRAYQSRARVPLKSLRGNAS